MVRNLDFILSIIENGWEEINLHTNVYLIDEDCLLANFIFFIEERNKEPLTSLKTFILCKFMPNTPGVNSFFLLMIFGFFHYSWFTVFCQFSAVQQGDPVTHIRIHSFFSQYHAPS